MNLTRSRSTSLIVPAASTKPVTNNVDKEPQAPYREDRWASALARPVFLIQARTPGG